MLYKFEVSGFKSFNEIFSLNLDKVKEYNFNREAVENNILVAIENGTQMQKDEPRFKNTAPYIDELIKKLASDEFIEKKIKDILGDNNGENGKEE